MVKTIHRMNMTSRLGVYIYIYSYIHIYIHIFRYTGTCTNICILCMFVFFNHPTQSYQMSSNPVYEPILNNETSTLQILSYVSNQNTNTLFLTFFSDIARRGPLTTISGFIPSYTHLQPWLNRVCWGYNYLYN